jgi:hypothetical protein
MEFSCDARMIPMATREALGVWFLGHSDGSKRIEPMFLRDNVCIQFAPHRNISKLF